MAETQPIVSPPTSSSSLLNTPKMSSTDQIITLFESLSFAEKLSLNERLATAMRKEGGGAAGKKRASKAKDGEQKPKRKAALGTLAWMAYVKHIKDTQPDMLEGHTKESEKLAIIKGIRAEDAEGYKAFCEAWKEEHKDDASAASVASEVSEAEEEEAAPAPVSAPAPKVQTGAEKIAAVKAAKAAAAAAPKAAAATPAKAAPKAAAKTAPGAPKKAVKAAAAPKKEELDMPVLTLDDVEYWHDPSSNFLWLKTGDSTVDGMGDEVGYYQPENAEEPIRAAAFGED